jgi:hypothetical protein
MGIYHHRTRWIYSGTMRNSVSDVFPLRLLLFLLVALIIAFAGLIRVFAGSMVKRLMAGGWPTAQGRVEFGSVVEQRVRYVSYFGATIHYSYSLSNEYYSGSFERAFRRESAADVFVKGMKDQMIFVRSNPKHPEESAVLKQDQPAGWPA